MVGIDRIGDIGLRAPSSPRKTVAGFEIELAPRGQERQSLLAHDDAARGPIAADSGSERKAPPLGAQRLAGAEAQRIAVTEKIRSREPERETRRVNWADRSDEAPF